MGNKVQAFEHTFHSGTKTTGNGTAMDVGGLSGVAVQISGISSDTITWEATIDGSNWVAVRAMNANDGAVATTATADGIYIVPVAGLDQLRARVSTHGSGTINAVGKGVTNAVSVGLKT